MSKFVSTMKNGIANFSRDEEGAQIVEYALIIAVISIALIIALAALTASPGGGFTAFIAKVGECLTGTCT